MKFKPPFALSALFALFAAIIPACSTPQPSYVTPTPRQSTLTWDAYTDPDGAGYWLYWALERETAPRSYTDTRRVRISRGASPEQIQVLTALPTQRGSLCFKLTAYDAVGNESAFSNEACGWFGINGPLNLSPRQ